MKVPIHLNKEQILSIPKLLEEKTIVQISLDFGVSSFAIWYWIQKLRKTGVEVKTRPRGRAGIL